MASLKEKRPLHTAFRSVLCRTYPISSLALKSGEWVTLSGGSVVRAVANNTDVADTTRLLGVVAHDTLTTDTTCKVYVVTPDMEVVLPALNGNNLAATATDDVGKSLNLRHVTGADGVYGVNTAASDKDKVVVMSIHPRYPVGTVGGWYICRVLPDELIASSES